MGFRADPSVDLWALAVLLSEGVAGRNPFRGENYSEMLERIVRADVADIASIAPECGASMAAFLRDALHRDIRRRPATAPEFRARLDAVVLPQRDI